MVKVYITNKTDKPIEITGASGTSWRRPVQSMVIGAGAIAVQAGDLKRPTSGRNWGWIFLRSAATVGPDLQAYVSARSGGAEDYAVQLYDQGKSQGGDPLMGTEATLHGGDVYLTIGYTFDPWMARLPAASMLHQVTIPGTHDSATYELLYPSQCQDTTMEQQLYMGVRYFDIRLDASVSGYRVVHGGLHGSGNTRYYLDDVARIMCDFLYNPARFDSGKETVVLQLKIDRGTDDPKTNQAIIDIIKDVFTKRGPDGLSHLYLKPILRQGPIPTMDDLRGKLVVLRRFELDQEDTDEACTPVKYFAWGDLFVDWIKTGGPNDWQQIFAFSCFEWPDQGANRLDYRNRNGLSFVIQDNYQLDPIPKALTTIAFLDQAAGGLSPDSWYLNFSSTKDPPTSASLINPLLVNLLPTRPSHPPHGYGTLLMDFVTLDLVREVVRKNF